MTDRRNTLALTKSDEPKLPSKIRLLRPHGFITEEGRHRHWSAGEIVADATEVALLTERKAVFEIV